MTPERIKEIFIALKTHLSSNSYDYFKYNGKMKGAPVRPNETFALRKLSAKISEEETLVKFFVFNMMNSYFSTGRINSYLPNYTTKDAHDSFLKWDSWFNSIGRNVENDFSIFKGKSLREIIDVENGHPLLLRKFMAGRIHPNTMAVFLSAYPQILKYWTEKSDDPVFDKFLQVINKYTHFIRKDKNSLEELKKSLEKTLKNQ